MKPLYVGFLMIAAAILGGLFVRWQTGQEAAVPAPRAAVAPAPAVAPVQPAPPPAPATEPKPAPMRASKLRAAKRASLARATEPRQVAENSGPAGPAAEPAPPSPATVFGHPASAAPPVPSASQASSEPEAVPPPPPPQVTLSAGTLLTVRTGEGLSSERNQAGDTFTATLEQPLVVEGYVIAERGARLEGRVVSVQRAGRVSGLADLTLELVQLRTSDGQSVPIETDTFVKRAEASRNQDAAKIGAGAVIGAVIGAVAGGGKGAAIGAGAGGAAGAGEVMATRGKPAVLPAESRLSFRLRNRITLTERRT